MIAESKEPLKILLASEVKATLAKVFKDILARECRTLLVKELLEFLEYLVREVSKPPISPSIVELKLLP